MSPQDKSCTFADVLGFGLLRRTKCGGAKNEIVMKDVQLVLHTMVTTFSSTVIVIDVVPTVVDLFLLRHTWLLWVATEISTAVRFVQSNWDARA